MSAPRLITRKANYDLVRIVQNDSVTSPLQLGYTFVRWNGFELNLTVVDSDDNAIDLDACGAVGAVCTVKANKADTTPLAQSSTLSAFNDFPNGLIGITVLTNTASMSAFSSGLSREPVTLFQDVIITDGSGDEILTITIDPIRMLLDVNREDDIPPVNNLFHFPPFIAADTGPFDATQVQANTVYTVPSGKKFKPLAGDEQCTLITGGPGAPTIRWTANGSDVLFLPGLSNADDIDEGNLKNFGNTKWYEAGDTFEWEVTVGTTATTQEILPYIQGILIDA